MVFFISSFKDILTELYYKTTLHDKFDLISGFIALISVVIIIYALRV